MAYINSNILTKVDTTNPEALRVIFDAMLDDLIERRQPRDTELFRYCVERVIPEDSTNSKLIEDYVEIAGMAFRDYHAERAKGAYMENGEIAYTIADNADDTNDTGDTDSTDE